MHDAPVGDDVYGEDPTVNELERYAADLLGKQAALYAPSGTQSNLLALFAHCERGDEYIVGNNAHTFRYEGGGAAVLGSIQPQTVPMAMNGCLQLDAIEQVIKPDDYHFARSKLVCLENSHAGMPLPKDYPEQVRELCDRHGLALHLDGARLFNAATFYQQTPAQTAQAYDSVSICLSKGLGAPVGSVLVGNNDTIACARRWRKVLGGGMRQAGTIASAGLYALRNHIVDLAQDHAHAAEIGQLLQQLYGATAIRIATNMVHLDMEEERYRALAASLADQQIMVGRPRWVFHRDIQAEHIKLLKGALVAAAKQN